MSMCKGSSTREAGSLGVSVHKYEHVVKFSSFPTDLLSHFHFLGSLSDYWQRTKKVWKKLTKSRFHLTRDTQKQQNQISPLPFNKNRKIISCASQEQQPAPPLPFSTTSIIAPTLEKGGDLKKILCKWRLLSLLLHREKCKRTPPHRQAQCQRLASSSHTTCTRFVSTFKR